MEFKTKKSTKIILASVLALIVIVVSGGPVLAVDAAGAAKGTAVGGAIAGPPGALIGSLLGGLGINAGDVAIKAVTGIVATYIYAVGQLAVGVIGIAIGLFQYTNFVNATIVTVGWNLVRDITNMVFVIMFLVMAFYTVLGKDEYSARKFLVRLVIAAVAVNFSRTIAGLIIDFSQVVMLTFVNGFQAVAGGNFVSAFGMTSWLQTSGVVDSTKNLAQYILGAILATVMLFTILSMVVMLVARIVMLWILVILSPFAFVASVLPGKIGKEAGKWWDLFINYNMAGPVLAFFVWLTLYYMNYLSASGMDNEGIKIVTTGDAGALVGADQQTMILGFIMSTIMLMIGVKIAAGTNVFGANIAQKGVDAMKKGAARGGKAVGAWAGRGALRQTEGTRLGMANLMAKVPGLRTLAFATRRGVQTARDKEEKKKLGNLETATPEEKLRMWRTPALRTQAGEAALRKSIMSDPRTFNQMSAGESMTLLDQEKKRLRAAKDTKGLEEVQGAEYKRLRGMTLDERMDRRAQLIARGASADEIETGSRAIMDDPIARRKLLNRPGDPNTNTPSGLEVAQGMMRGSRDYAKTSGKIENLDQLLNIEKASPQLIDAERRMADDYHYDINSGAFTNPATRVADRADLLATFRAPDGGTNFANFAGAAQTRGSAFIATAMEGLTAGQIIRQRNRDDLTPEQDVAVQNLVADLLSSNDPELADKAERVRNNEQYITGAEGRQHRRGGGAAGGPAGGGGQAATPIVASSAGAISGTREVDLDISGPDIEVETPTKSPRGGGSTGGGTPPSTAPLSVPSGGVEDLEDIAKGMGLGEAPASHPSSAAWKKIDESWEETLKGAETTHPEIVKAKLQDLLKQYQSAPRRNRDMEEDLGNLTRPLIEKLQAQREATTTPAERDKISDQIVEINQPIIEAMTRKDSGDREAKVVLKGFEAHDRSFKESISAEQRQASIGEASRAFSGAPRVKAMKLDLRDIQRELKEDVSKNRKEELEFKEREVQKRLDTFVEGLDEDRQKLQKLYKEKESIPFTFGKEEEYEKQTKPLDEDIDDLQEKINQLREIKEGY